MKSSILDQLRERSCSPVHPKSVPLADLSNVENRKVIILTMSAEFIAEFNCLILKLFDFYKIIIQFIFYMRPICGRWFNVL